MILAILKQDSLLYSHQGEQHRARTLAAYARVFIRPDSRAKQQKNLDVNQLMSISYGSPSWNKDSGKIDSAYLVMRDRNSGKIVQIQLEETEPDSSRFNGQFSVNLGGAISPEVYIPPAELRQSEKDYRKLYEMIQSNKLPRKPLILKKTEKGQSVLDVYDTREQAEAALKAYQEEQALAQELKKKNLIKPIPSQSALAAAAQAERKAQLDKLALEAAKREADRVRLEQIEKQKAEERERQARLASEQERAERQAKAKQLSAEALAFYDQGDFVSAERNSARPWILIRRTLPTIQVRRHPVPQPEVQ
ncbi:MAG: hypothetical protein HC902_13395 [Calothrix sp. SM1_5_4]|nr:hypothetical protein [Calothrix sp. SM1_5_4]